MNFKMNKKLLTEAMNSGCTTMGQLAISSMSALVFSGFILFDTSRIIRGEETNYVSATISMYLNILNLFTSLLSILGIMNDD